MFETFRIKIEQEGKEEYLEIEAPNKSEAIRVACHLSVFNWGTMTVLEFKK